jgi:hypothetical protein
VYGRMDDLRCWLNHVLAHVTLQLAEIVDHVPGLTNARPPLHGGSADELGDIDATRACLRAELALSPGRLVLLNYHMGTLGQSPWGGHVSPLAGYHAGSDSFLILDVWFYTAPLWASCERVEAAMRAIDHTSGKSRGLVFVSLEAARNASAVEPCSLQRKHHPADGVD